MENYTIPAAIMGTMKADIEFEPVINNEQMAMLEAEMRYNGLNNIRSIVLEDSFGNIVGKLKVNDLDFNWERFFGEDEC